MYRQIGMWDQKWVIGNWKMNGRLQNSNALMHRFRIHPTAERVLSFFGRGEERFVINDPAVVQCYGLAFFRRPFRRNLRHRRNVCVWVLNLRHLAFWTHRLF